MAVKLSINEPKTDQSVVPWQVVLEEDGDSIDIKFVDPSGSGNDLYVLRLKPEGKFYRYDGLERVENSGLSLTKSGQITETKEY